LRVPDRPSWDYAGSQRIGAESSVRLVRRSRQAVSAAFRYSLPHRGPRTVALGHASLNLARPSRARTEGPTPTEAVDSTLPDFRPLQRMEDRGFGPRGLTSPATFRPQRFARSRRLTPRDPFRACFIPVTLLGFEPSGLAPLRGAVPLSRPSALLPFSSSTGAAKRRAEPRSSELSSPRRIPPAGDRNLPAGDALLAFFPLRLSRPPRWGRSLEDCALRAHRRTSLPLLPCTSPVKAGASESSPTEAWAFPHC
jgi:hypothetical protein